MNYKNEMKELEIVSREIAVFILTGVLLLIAVAMIGSHISWLALTGMVSVLAILYFFARHINKVYFVNSDKPGQINNESEGVE